MKTSLFALAVGAGLACASPDALAQSPKAKKAEAEAAVFVPAEDTAPPSMVWVKGGKAVIGSTPKEVEEILANPAYHGVTRLLDAETPQHTVQLQGFYGGLFEITNEQYREFVVATERKPPEHWLEEEITKASQEYLRVEGKKARDLRKEGKAAPDPKWTEELKEKWLEENWRDAEWKIPPGEEAQPVAFVDYEDARDYCEWAGLRLPTEFEWSYMARGTGKRIFPWGDEWEAAGRAHTGGSARDVATIGSYAEGKSPFGMLDMGGNVWEWTDSPYTAFPKFKVNTYKVKVGRKKEELKRESDFRPVHRVIKGGGYGDGGLLACRVAMRQGTLKSQTAAELGFRAVAGETPGTDRLVAGWRKAFRSCPVRLDDGTLSFDDVSGIDRWQTASVEGERPEGYAVPKAYDVIAFAPRGDLHVKPGAKLKQVSAEEFPITVGALTTTVAMAEPALEPGDYLVLYRAKGKLAKDAAEEEGEAVEAGAKKDKKGSGAAEAPQGGQEGTQDDEAAPADEVPMTPERSVLEGIDPKNDQLIFVDAKTGMFKAAIRYSLPNKDARYRDTVSTVGYESKKVIEGTGADKKFVQQDWLTIEVRMPTVPGKRCVPMAIPLRVADGALGEGWRRRVDGK